MDPRVVYNPANVIVDSSASATVTFPGGNPTGNVTISVKYNGLVIETQSFSGSPYVMSFTPFGVGTHKLCVSWTGGSYSEDFEVRP